MCMYSPDTLPICDDYIGLLDYPRTPEALIPPPLKQMTLGIKLGHVICDDDHILTYNNHYKPACVFPDSENSLLIRGWAKLRLLLPAGPDPIKELELTGQNEMSYRITGNVSYGDDVPPLSHDRIREIAWDYSQMYHPGEQYLEYSIPSIPSYNHVEETIEFELLEWGNYSDCWNLKLRIIDVKNNPVYEDDSVKYCSEPDGIHGTFHSYSMGKDFEEFVCPHVGYYRIEVSNGGIFSPQILQNFVCIEYKPEPLPEPKPKQITPSPESEKTPDGTVKVEGEMADKICEIVGINCPLYYFGNIQEDGSVMVYITSSDTVKEKQFIFFIKNNTLSYEIKENEN